ncbi:alpha-amylase family glycosyl hydrolase [Armatimonas sp.]|uniref:alpha-amylase family glycosyl hydrolase n=1 Tax=Armatimonas sp. TaxID=1872638 RepID=UPI0037538812
MIPELVRRDPTLSAYSEVIQARLAHYDALREQLGVLRGSISQGHHYFGFTCTPDGFVTYREWAPAAKSLHLVGDFNGWDRRATPLACDAHGTWHVTLSGSALPPGSRVKVHVHGADDSRLDRIPAYIRRAVQDATTKDFCGEVWFAPVTPPASNSGGTPTGLRIYEAHVGMAQEDAKVGTFAEFTANVLPRIAALGYDTVQLMAIQEHPYYGSFGYHVSSFYGVSSRFGTPDELRTLIQTAHTLGLRVLMDLVHSHAVKNIREGLSRFDGTEWQYFHDGPRGYHSGWDSRCFDYSKLEVLRFLLSNIRYWLEEYGFDGFRFDGVTSMLYHDHGIRDFNGYPDYFSANVDDDALCYLQLANALAQEIQPEVVTVAEDVSGMPGLCRPVTEGGVGFGYRLSMGVPDFWIKLTKDTPDEAWSVGQLWATLTNRRWDEKHIGYAESHDQSIVGDQTLAFRLMGSQMYTEMTIGRESLVVDRGMALHKLIRLLTYTLAGEGWLGFIGNEFGHPEWVDFPRADNDWSYTYARRQWSLADSPFLRYGLLKAFDAALMHLPQPTEPPELLALHEDNHLLIYQSADLVIAANLHPTRSLSALRIPIPEATDYCLLLDTDRAEFGGQERIVAGSRFIWEPVAVGGAGQSVQVYLPSRCALVLTRNALSETRSEGIPAAIQ